jgi:GGDEF domain-containing protein
MAIFPEDGVELTSLIDRADQAMYQVKRTRQRAGRMETRTRSHAPRTPNGRDARQRRA